MRSLRSFLVCLLPLCIVLASTEARAQDVEKQVSRMNKKAMEDYDSLEFDSARKTLIDAVSMLRANGLDETPLAAKVFVNLGALYINGFKDRTRGQQQFVNALRIKPDIKIDPAIATPEIEEAFTAAQKVAGVKRGGTTAPPPTEPETPPTPPREEVHGLQHTPVDESRPNTPVPIRAQLGSDTGATRVFLFFRGSGHEDFVTSPMKNTGGADWVGVIPGDALNGKAVQYYLEARDARGRAVVGSGSAVSPYIIMVNEGAAAPTAVPEVDVEDPLAAERARRKREEEKKNRMQRFFIYAMLGTGFGYEPAGNHTEVAWQYQPQPGNNCMPGMTDCFIRQPVGTGGVAFAPLHVGIELGVNLTHALSLSVLGRFQVYTAADAETQPGANITNPTTKASGAVAALLRLRYKFLEGRIHPYIHLDIGGGQIRHVLDISSAQQGGPPLVDSFTGESYNMNDRAFDSKGNPIPGQITEGNQTVCPSGGAACTDTIALGYLLVGGGAGLWIDVHKYVGLVLDVALLGAIGIGDSQSGMNIDIALGAGVHF
jgi:hypothetical protein